MFSHLHKAYIDSIHFKSNGQILWETANLHHDEAKYGENVSHVLFLVLIISLFPNCLLKVGGYILM